MDLIRANVCKNREYGVSREISNFFIFCLNDPYSELFSKILFEDPEALDFFQIGESLNYAF